MVNNGWGNDDFPTRFPTRGKKKHCFAPPFYRLWGGAKPTLSQYNDIIPKKEGIV